MAFFDDFERPDGPLGPNWVTDDAFVSISSGHVVASLGRAAWVAAAIGSGDQTVTIRVTNAYALGQETCAIVKANADHDSYYQARKTWTGQRVLVLEKVSSGVPTGLSSVVIPDNYVGTTDITLSYSGAGALHAEISDGYSCDATDSTHAANSYAGMFLGRSDTWVTQFSADAPVTVSIDVTPDPIPAFGTEVRLSVDITGATWTPGVPGSSTLTCDHGAISDQVTLTPTHMECWYDPADYVGPVVFTESEYGAQDTVNATADPEEFPDLFNCLLTPEGAALINDTAAARSGLLITMDTPVVQASEIQNVGDALGYFWRSLAHIVDPDGDLPPNQTQLDAMWSVLNGRNYPVENESIYDELLTTRNTANHIEELFEGVEPDTWVSILQLMSYLKGVDNKDLSQVYDQIGASDTAIAASLMNAIEAVRGTDLPSIRTVVDLIGELSTIAGYDLSSVKGWIEAARGSGLPTIKDVRDDIAAIKGDDAPNLYSMTTQLNDAADALYHLLVSMGLLTTNDTKSIQSVLDAIEGISGGDLTPVLTAIANLRGDEVSTVKAIQDSLTAYRGGKPYTVQDILDAIGADSDNPNWTVPALLAILAAALMGDTALLAALVAKLATGKLDLLLDIVDTIASLGTFFHGLWDHFNPSSPTYRPLTAPIYPGGEYVNLLAPVPFDSQVTIETRMDGAFIDIDTPGEHPYQIKFSEPARYGRLGVFSFMTDDGHLEPIQPIQWGSQVATPKAIATPSGIVVQCKAGTVGTIVPWTLK